MITRDLVQARKEEKNKVVAAQRLTIWPSRNLITASAAGRVSKAISATMMGCSLTSRQLRTTPPTGVTTLSISAAVVPGAKFCAITTDGPASPLMEMPLADAAATAAAAGALAAPPPRMRSGRGTRSRFSRCMA